MFAGAVSSFIFKSFYFDYRLIDFADYRGYYTFFVDGDFIVPLIIFFFVWTTSHYFALFIFKLGNFRVAAIWRHYVIQFSLQEVLISRTSAENDQLLTRADMDLDNFAREIFQSILRSVRKVDRRKLQKAIDVFQRELEDDFVLLFRAAIATVVFISIVPHFGWILFTLGILSMLFYMFLLFLMYQLVEIVPVLLSKSISELEAILNQYGVASATDDERTIDVELVN